MCQECVACVSLAAEKGDLGRGMAGGDTTGHGHSVSASVTKPIRLCWRWLTEVLLLAGRWCHGACHEASQGIPTEDGWARGWEGWQGGQAEVPCACIHACPGGPAAASGPQSSLTGAPGSCCVNYLPSVVAGCSLWSMWMYLTFSNLSIVYFRVYICSFWQKVGIS